ncbi:LHFPL tetraspan sub member 3 protein [Bulinus truncatus]|nr:LHFPL tetraspan sub member 3 protein [Bulinus truncatus]
MFRMSNHCLYKEMTMDGREVEYNTDLTKIHHTNYVRNSRAIVVLWAVFTCVFFILNVVVWVQPQWIGDTGNSAVAGFFGLYKFCLEVTAGGDFSCNGDFISWDTIPNEYFKATSVMVGVSCLLAIGCIACFLLFCLINTATVLIICAWLQFLSGTLIAISCIVYPGGWYHPDVKKVCGAQSGRYNIGECGMRWGYALAIVLIFDAFILCILAWVLATKQANLLPEVYKKEKEPIKD